MNKMFGKKLSAQEQLKKHDRELRKSERDLAREDKTLEKQEKEIELEIKKAAKLGQNDVCKSFAKQLIQVRKQRERTRLASSQITGVRSQSRALGVNVAMTNTVANAARAMENMSKIAGSQNPARALGEFKMLSEKLNTAEELINDTVDDILAESDDEEDNQGVLDKVLDEIGIEIKAKLNDVPVVSTGEHSAESSSKTTDADLEKQLERLKAL